MPLGILNVALVLVSGRSDSKGTQIFSFLGLYIHFARIEPIFTGFQFSNHLRSVLSEFTPAAAPDSGRSHPAPGFPARGWERSPVLVPSGRDQAEVASDQCFAFCLDLSRVLCKFVTLPAGDLA